MSLRPLTGKFASEFRPVFLFSIRRQAIEGGRPVTTKGFDRFMSKPRLMCVLCVILQKHSWQLVSMIQCHVWKHIFRRQEGGN